MMPDGQLTPDVKAERRRERAAEREKRLAETDAAAESPLEKFKRVWEAPSADLPRPARDAEYPEAS